ncbi:MAG: hypothetical protein P9M13_07020 [Candidatus Ancaeobacter aquaticus]|nr:hypothetical protein [Candidatus Ancaeobacter aquaticus]
MIIFREEIFKIIVRRYPNEVREEHLLSELEYSFPEKHLEREAKNALIELLEKKIIDKHIHPYSHQGYEEEITSYFLTRDVYRNINRIKIGNKHFIRLLDKDRFRVDDINYLVEELSNCSDETNKRIDKLHASINNTKKDISKEVFDEIKKSIRWWSFFLIAISGLIIAIIVNRIKICEFFKDLL